MKAAFEVNGESVEVDVEPRISLADCLRDVLGLTGTHLGCEHGVCGACTVIVDGQAVRSCLTLAVQADGERITTVEGLSPEAGLSPLQAAFRKHHALQCGFCTPGMVTTAHALLSEEPDADADRVREVLSGNICRCTGYVPIVEAVLEARFVEWVSSRTTAESIAVLLAHSVPAGQVQGIDDVAENPFTWERDILVTLQHPESGPVKLLGSPFKSSRSPGVVDTPAPTVGQHTKQVLSEILGYSDARIDELTEKQVIAVSPS